MAGNQGHEERDVNVIAVTRFGIGLSLILVVSLFAVWGLFTLFKNREAKEPAGAPPAAWMGANAHRLPPEPRLEEHPAAELQDVRSAEEQILNGYGWIDRDKGVVRIPIDRAMDILAQRGLPARPPAQGTK